MRSLLHPVVTAAPAPSSATTASTFWGDAALVVGATLVTALLCARFNVAESLRRVTAPWEGWQLDELPVVLVVLAAGLAWFALRRYRDARREISRRHAAEAQLEGALAANRRLSLHYVELREAEHRSFARELHDELGQYLNVIKLDAVGIRDHRGADTNAVLERSSAIIRSCDHIHGALADLLRQLRPVGLEELGLTSALEHCLQTWRARLPTTSLQFVATGELDSLPGGLAIVLYRLVQEALTNVAKHSSARHVTVQLARSRTDHDSVRLSVIDDGVGADPSGPTAGLGLIGMRERIEGLGGEILLQTSPGRGFGLQAQIPVSPAGHLS